MSPDVVTPEDLPQERAHRISFRRGLTLLGMTLLVPGSAQLAVGGRGLGRFAIRVWLTVLVVAGLFLVLFLTQRSWAIGFYAQPWVQWGLAGIFVVLGAGWALLFLDSWRLSRPRSMGHPRQWWMALGTVVLATAVCFSGVQAATAARSQAKLFGSVFLGGGQKKANAGRINVLLIGADADSHRHGVRTDTIMVASASAETGRTVVFSLPRNLQGAKFPTSSPLHRLYPDGYRCAEEACLLNAVYELGREHADDYPGVRDPGLKAVEEIVSETLGLPINYHAMIDLRGFIAFIDALGGIRLDIAKPVPIGGGTSRVSGYIQPGKDVHLDGYHALWFARSRHNSNDYERMARQKCVINAMVKQLNPVTAVTKFNELAEASEQIVRTDVPAAELGVLLDLAEKGRRLPLASVSFAPPLIVPAKPDLPQIRKLVAEAIARSQALDKEASVPTPSAKPTASPDVAESPKPSSAPSLRPAAPAPTETQRETDDLSEICGVAG